MGYLLPDLTKTMQVQICQNERCHSKYKPLEKIRSKTLAARQPARRGSGWSFAYTDAR
jgi:hypothetical protein